MWPSVDRHAGSSHFSSHGSQLSLCRRCCAVVAVQSLQQSGTLPQDLRNRLPCDCRRQTVDNFAAASFATDPLRSYSLGLMCSSKSRSVRSEAFVRPVAVEPTADNDSYRRIPDVSNTTNDGFGAEQRALFSLRGRSQTRAVCAVRAADRIAARSSECRC